MSHNGELIRIHSFHPVLYFLQPARLAVPSIAHKNLDLHRCIRDQGNHGHGDDLLVLVMPETLHELSVTLWPRPALTTEQRTKLQAEAELFIRAAFRESGTDDYQPTLTYPQARFSFSRLAEELHQQFPGIESLHFDNADIVSELTIPRISSLQVVLP